MLPPGPAHATGDPRATHNGTPTPASNAVPLPNNSFTVNASGFRLNRLGSDSASLSRHRRLGRLDLSVIGGRVFLRRNATSRSRSVFVTRPVRVPTSAVAPQAAAWSGPPQAPTRSHR